MTLVKISPRPLARQIIIIGRARIDSAGVAISAPKVVLDGPVEVAGDPPAHHQFQHVRLGESRRFDLPQQADDGVRPLHIAGQRRVDVARAELLDAARVDVVRAGRQRFGELTLHAHVELKRVERSQVEREPDDTSGLIGEDASGREWVRVARIVKIHLAQSLPVKAQLVGDGENAGAVVKDPRAAAQYRLALFARRIGERQARGNIVPVAEKILLIVTQAGGEGEIRPHQNLILREQAEFLLPKRQVTVPLIDGKQKGPLIQIIPQSGEGEHAAEARLVAKPAAADVRDIHAASDKMFALCPGKDVIELYMVFGRPPISLSATAGEGVLNDQLRNARVEAARPAILMPDAAGQFVDQFGREDLSQAEKKMVLATSGIGGHFRQIKPADAGVAARILIDFEPERKRGVFADLVIYSKGEF